jgi:hypothetical protein
MDAMEPNRKLKMGLVGNEITDCRLVVSLPAPIVCVTVETRSGAQSDLKRGKAKIIRNNGVFISIP